MNVHLVGPIGLSDPARPSGGNVYDVRLAGALRSRGHDVELHETTTGRLSSVLAGLPDGAAVARYSRRVLAATLASELDETVERAMAQERLQRIDGSVQHIVREPGNDVNEQGPPRG